MFIELTDKDGHKIYINFAHVQRFHGMEWYDNNIYTILCMTDSSSILVRESIEDVLRLINKCNP